MWVTDIKRGANYYFKVTERKVASELFAEYELAKNSEFYATFSENRSRIYLIRQRPNKFIEESDIYYERIK